MKNNLRIRICCILVVLILMSVVSGCVLMKPFVSDTLFSPTPIGSFIHYAPSELSIIRLEFDYPQSWIFSGEVIDQESNIVSMGLIDPRMKLVPTRAPNESQGTPSDFGRIYIDVESLLNNQTLNSRFEDFKQGHMNTRWIKVLDTYETTLDGYTAFILESQIEPMGDNGFSSIMFEKAYFFMIQDQLYQITFVVAENERDYEFEQGFMHFINSLKVVPIMPK